jgi:hypothetical protein
MSRELLEPGAIGRNRADSARKHGIGETSIVHAWENAIKLAEFECQGEERLFVIGPDESTCWSWGRFRSWSRLASSTLTDGAPSSTTHCEGGD